MSQENLAELLQTKSTYISEMEHGKRNISVDYIDKLARVFNLEPYKLLINNPPVQNKKIKAIKG